MTLRLEPQSTALVVIDIQDKLAAAMPPDVLAGVVKNASVLIRGMQALRVPVIGTEQYPKGLGPTLPELRQVLGGVQPLAKMEFDCSAADGFTLPRGTRSVVLCGMEAHICVLQTAVGLRERGLDVWVAEDAICSRLPANRESALRLLEKAGAVAAPTESILFGLLGRAGTPEFKEISKLVR